MYLAILDFLKACPIEPDLMDNDWCYLVFEFSMNYTLDGLRYAYHKEKKKEKEKVTADLLRKLGYTEEQIQKARL